VRADHVPWRGLRPGPALSEPPRLEPWTGPDQRSAHPSDRLRGRARPDPELHWAHQVSNQASPPNCNPSDGVILDIHVSFEDGTRVNVEMQARSIVGMRERSVYHVARMHGTELVRGDAYTELTSAERDYAEGRVRRRGVTETPPPAAVDAQCCQRIAHATT